MGVVFDIAFADMIADSQHRICIQSCNSRAAIKSAMFLTLLPKFVKPAVGHAVYRANDRLLTHQDPWVLQGHRLFLGETREGLKSFFAGPRAERKSDLVKAHA